MPKIVDQYNDPAFATLYRLTQHMPGLETFVKDAEIRPGEVAELVDTAFAWPDERRFPIHTEKYAALSYAYALDQKVPDPVVDRIKDALDVYGVPADTFKAAESKFASESAEDYLLPDLKLFRVKTANDVHDVQPRLLQNLTKLDLEHRATACGNLVKKAGELGVKLEPAVLKLAGFVVSSTKVAREWLDARAVAVKDERFKTAYEKLANGLVTQPPESKDRPTLLKLASVIAELDEKSGLDRYYDRKLPDALQTVFNTEKIASDTVEIVGEMVPVSKLASLPASFWSDLGGPELSDEIAPGGTVDTAKLATIVDTLPLDLKLVLRSQLKV